MGGVLNLGRRVVRGCRHVAHFYQRRLKQLAYAVGGVKKSLNGDSGTVALTFDDGPHPRFTPQALDVLKRFDVPATFFLVGERVREHPELVQQILAAGHRIGSHSDSHPDMWTVSSRAALREYRAGRDSVDRVAGQKSRLFRPPKGWIGIVQSCITRALGMRVWLWTLAGSDWLPDITAEEILAEIGTPSSGDVILLHDGLERPMGPTALDRSATIGALEKLIPAVQASGLRFVALP